LMAALIIIGVVFALVRISNEGSSKDEPEAFFDLGDEISFETKRVLDYGEISQNANVAALAEQLLNKYSENIAMNDVAFIYGDTSINPPFLSAYYYDPVTVRAVSIYQTSVPLTIPNGGQIQVSHSLSTGKAIINIEGIDYSFDIKQGQNFYFVISREDEGEKFVTIE